MNSKLSYVTPQPVKGQYIAGSGAGNYFLIVDDNAAGIVAFRPLSVSVPAIGTKPTNGVQTRVRVVPAVATPKLDRLMTRFGFGKVNGGSTPVHYSKVTSSATEAIDDAKLALSAA